MILLPVLLVLLTGIYFWKLRKFYILGWKMGGPYGYPLIGSAVAVYYLDKIIQNLLDFRTKYGTTFFTWLGVAPIIVVSGPESVEKIFSSREFMNKAFIYNPIKSMFGDGLFTSSDSTWLTHRRLLNPTFSHKILLSFVQVFNSETRKLNLKLEESLDREVDVLDLLQKCTLDTACQTTMGKEMNFQGNENTKILENYYKLIVITAKRIFVPWYIFDFSFQFSSLYIDYMKAKKIIIDFVDDLITHKVDLAAKNEYDPLTAKLKLDDNDDTNILKSKNIFVDQTLKLVSSEDFSFQDVRSESNHMIIAASETTANVTFIVLMCLAMFPEEQEKVYEEIRAVLHGYDRDLEVTFEHIQDMPYLDMTINEAMRVLAPVPLVARSCSADFDWGNGIIIPKGTQVAIDIFNMHRDEAIWGPNAKTFNPEHFLKSNFTQKHPYAFVPFTKGIRNCIGMRYAAIAVKIMLVKILFRYRLSTTFRFQDLEFIEDIVLKFKQTPELIPHKRIT